MSEIDLPGDSLDYDVLFNAAKKIKNVDALICEIGTRRGGSTKYIIDAVSNPNFVHNMICIDPYGNIEYCATEEYRGRLDYTNDMKNECMVNLYKYVQGKNINLMFYNLEDIEFFDKFAYGVPVYIENKRLLDKYSLVFFDGPHDIRSIMNEIEFFKDKVIKGSVYIFDDVLSYPHATVDEYLLENGFTRLEVGKENRKISYIKI